MKDLPFNFKKVGEGIASILKQIKTILSIAGLAIIAIAVIIIVVVFQSPDKSGWLLLALVILSFLLIGYILWLISSLNIKGVDNVEKPTDFYRRFRDHEYLIPSTLIKFVHEHGGVETELRVTTLRVSTILFLKEGDITVRTSMRSTKKIETSRFVSHPLTATSFGEKTSYGGTSISFHGVRPYQQEILVLESNRIIPFGTPRADAKEDDVLLQSLYANILKTEFHEYAGTRILAPTERVRLLLYFPKDLIPEMMTPMQILANGQIQSVEFRTGLVKEQGLWIVEFDNPDLNSGVYSCWIWPH